MEEKVLKKSKNGLAMVTLFILLYAAAIAAIIVGSIMVEQAETKAGWIVLIVAGGVYAAIGWIFFIGPHQTFFLVRSPKLLQNRNFLDLLTY